MEAQISREMPRYKCHKEVHALKIKAITFDYELARAENRETDGSAMISPFESGYAAFKVDHAFVSKHLRALDREEIINGYYVVYKDGYQSFSPADAFEEGYTLIQS